MAAETDQVAVAREVAVFAVRGDVAVTSAELADWTFVAFCEQIELLARHSCRRATFERLSTTKEPSRISCEMSARNANANGSEIIDAREDAIVRLRVCE